MVISLSYVYQKILELDPSAEVIDEHAWRLRIQWLAMSSYEQHGREGFLYFISSAEEAGLTSRSTASFACVAPRSLADRFKGIPRIVVNDDTDITLLFDHAVHEVDKYRNWQESLHSLLIGDSSLEEILNMTYELVPRPMYIADPCWRMIARVDADMNEMSAIWHQQIQHGYLPMDTVEKLNSSGEYDLIKSSNRAFYVNTKAFILGYIAKTIKYNGRFLGYLFIIDTWHDLGPCEIEIAEHLGKLLASVLGTRKQYLQSIDRYHESMISAILEQPGIESLSAMRTILGITTWKASGDFRLVITKYSADDLRNNMTRMRVNAILCDGYDCYAIPYDDMLVVIFHDSEPNTDDFIDHVRSCARITNRRMAVSSRFTDFNLFPTTLEYAMKEFEIFVSNSHQSDQLIIEIDRLFLRRLAEQCLNIPCCYEADRLRAYDREHGTDYVKTLHTYLLHGANAASAADAMYLHRNTMHSRLEKIAIIIGRQLDDPVNRLRILVSLNNLLFESQLTEDMMSPSAFTEAPGDRPTRHRA